MSASFAEQVRRFQVDADDIPGRPLRLCQEHTGRIHPSIDKTCKSGVHIAKQDAVEFVEWCSLNCFPVDLKSFGEDVWQTFNHRGVTWFPHKNVPLAACYFPTTCEKENCRYLHGTRDALVDKFAAAALSNERLPFVLPHENDDAQRKAPAKKSVVKPVSHKPSEGTCDITRWEVRQRVNEISASLASGIFFDMAKLLRLPAKEEDEDDVPPPVEEPPAEDDDVVVVTGDAPEDEDVVLLATAQALAAAKLTPEEEEEGWGGMA